MDLMEIRRNMMGVIASTPTEQWDYIILPVNPNAEGRGAFPTKRINMVKGQTITVQYSGIKERSGNGLIDGYFAGTSPALVYTRDLTSDDGTIVLTATKTSYVSIGQNRNTAEGTMTSYAIKEIKIRVE